MSRKRSTASRKSTARETRAANTPKRPNLFEEMVDEDIQLFYEYDKWNEPRRKWFVRAQKFLEDLEQATTRPTELSKAELKGIHNVVSSYQRRLADDALLISRFASKLTDLRQVGA